jgi:lycopene cyclase domain-containing protein
MLIVFNFDKAYTVYISSTVIVALVFALFDKTNVIQSYYSTFLVILIPFIVVNAVLTGSFIAHEVVWYNDHENLGIRFLTIPAEDFGYAFSLILFNLLLVAKLKNRANVKLSQ